jgi:hypothetical protein
MKPHFNVVIERDEEGYDIASVPLASRLSYSGAFP